MLNPRLAPRRLAGTSRRRVPTELRSTTNNLGLERGLSVSESHQRQDEQFSARESFLAMSEFVWRFGCRAGDDLMTLIGDTHLESDGWPTDPAAWDDWLDCLDSVRSGGPLRPGSLE